MCWPPVPQPEEEARAERWETPARHDGERPGPAEAALCGVPPHKMGKSGGCLAPVQERLASLSASLVWRVGGPLVSGALVESRESDRGVGVVPRCSVSSGVLSSVVCVRGQTTV